MGGMKALAVVFILLFGIPLALIAALEVVVTVIGIADHLDQDNEKAKHLARLKSSCGTARLKLATGEQV
jgi:hypothetical protein